MPTVPYNSNPNQSQPFPKVNPTFLMMAAAELHEAGRLVEPIGSEATIYDKAPKLNKGPA